MTEIVVREAEIGDAPAIGYVHVRSWQEAYRGQVPDTYLDRLSIGQRIDVWRDMLATGSDETNWVVMLHGEVVGFAGAGPSRDADADLRTGELFAIYLLAGHWGAGAGSALLDRAVGWLRERFDEATLWVLATNARATHFYEMHGWRRDGATKDDDRGSFVLHEVRYRIVFDPELSPV